MSTIKNIEEKVYTLEQLGKLEVLRQERSAENHMRKNYMESIFKRWVPRNGDKVSSNVLTHKIETKRGIILKVKVAHKTGELNCDVRFGMFVFEGVPSKHLRHSPAEDPRESDWTGNLALYTKIKEFENMPTKKLLKILKIDRFSDEAGSIKKILSTREHIPKKSERKMKSIKYIKWKDFCKDSNGVWR